MITEAVPVSAATEYRRTPKAYRDERRPFVRRAPRGAWVEQAVTWRAPERTFTCCGTEFKAMTAESLLLLRNAHVMLHRKAR